MVKTNKLINFNQNYHYFSIFIKYHQNQRNKMVKLIKQSNIIKNQEIHDKSIKSIENIISFIFIKQLIFHI